MSNKDFVHLHSHTHYSVQDALPSPEEYAYKNREMNFGAAAITDHGRMGGAVEFVDSCRKPYKEYDSILPIVGLEAYICSDRKNKETRTKNHHLTLLAKNEVGYKNLLKIDAESHRSFYYKPRIDWEFMSEHSEGLIACSGCLASEINSALLKGGEDLAEPIVKRYFDLFGEDFYMEYQYHGIPEQKKVLPSLERFAKKYNIEPVVTNDVHYLNKMDYEIHDVLLQMKDMSVANKNTEIKKSDLVENYSSHNFYLKSHEEIQKIFGNRSPHAIQNTLKIAEKVEDYFKIGVNPFGFLPIAKIDSSNENFIKFWKTQMPKKNENEAYLAYLAMLGLKKMGLDKNKDYINRLKSELRTIWYSGVTNYFLIQFELCNFMKSKDVLYGIRGSGVGSLVNYCLEISIVDPLPYGLLFERFWYPGRGVQYKLDIEGYSYKEWQSQHKDVKNIEKYNELHKKIQEFKDTDEYQRHESEISKELYLIETQERAGYLLDLADKKVSVKENNNNLWSSYFLGISQEKPSGELVIDKVNGLPDIDTDIADDRRDEVISWVKDRFGDSYVSPIGTKNTYGLRSSIQSTLKVSSGFQNKWGEKYDFQSKVVSKSIPFKSKTMQEAIDESVEFANYAKMYPKEIEIANHMVGRIQSMGTHAAGVLICNKPIEEFSPIERTKDGMSTAFDMADVERVGLVKYDLLGLSTYQIIFKALKNVEKYKGVKINLNTLPLNDKNVFSVYNQGKTSTVFQCASDGMNKYLKDIHVDRFEDIIAVVALYRPGPLDFIPDYVKGKRNPEGVQYGHPVIKKHLEETYNIMVYQEQAMFLAREMAGLSWVEIDKLRKSISKKQSDEFLKFKQNFHDKALLNGYTSKDVNYVVSLMEKFGAYCFNKSHATIYSTISYWTAYLRYYYPVEWFAAVIDVEFNKEDKMASYLKEMKLDKIQMKQPNVNYSDLYPKIDNNTIYLPLNIIKNVGNNASDIILNAPYKSLKDLCFRTKYGQGIISNLAEGGALSCFPECQRKSVESIMDLWEKYAEEKRVFEKKEAQVKKQGYRSNSMFDDDAGTMFSNKFDLR